MPSIAFSIKTISGRRRNGAPWLIQKLKAMSALQPVEVLTSLLSCLSETNDQPNANAPKHSWPFTACRYR
jgi:hypothetical protein